MDFLLIFLLILLNAAFAMSEMALTASRKARLTVMAQAGDKGAAAAQLLMTQPTRFLSTVQVGITSIGVLNGIVGEAAFSEALAIWLTGLGLPDKASSYTATALVVTVITFLTIIFGELVPKRIGQLYPEAVARVVARPMQWVAKLATPFVWLLSATTSQVLHLLKVNTGQKQEVTHEEISANLEEGVIAGVIDQQEHSMVQNVFDLDGRPLASLMLPVDDVIWLDTAWGLQKAIVHAAQGGHSWYPVCAGDWAHVQGVVSTSSLLLRQHAASATHPDQLDDTLKSNPANPPFSQTSTVGKTSSNWQDLIHPVHFVPETLNAMLLLSQFQQRTERMVLVVDEYGAVQGLITPQDLLQAITGELHTPAQGLSSSTLNPDGSWKLDGQLSVQELKNKLNIESLPGEEDARYNTLGGLVMSELGDLPQVGSIINAGGWTFQVTQMDARRVETVLARLTFAADRG